MTASGGVTCLPTKGLDISLAALQRQDPYINNIVDVASQVALYTFNNETNEWEKTDVEGTLFVYTRLASPKHGFTIMNRLSMDNLTEPITKDLDFQLQDPFLLYRNARLSIYGIWFYDKADCQRIAELTKNLTRQEQQLHTQTQTSGWVSPQRLESKEGKGVDILQMLTKARDEYDKGKLSSEPKEIGSGGSIYDNPNLIKPIPLKPKERQQTAVQDFGRQSQSHNQQDGETESKHLSIAALFGGQARANSVSPQPSSGACKAVSGRPAVVRSLSYNDPSPTAGGAVVSSSPNQHCPAIQKLMSGPRGPVVPLQPVSESPENRLCENGPAQSRPDPIQRLLQNPPQSSHTVAYTSIPPPPLIPQLVGLEAAAFSESPPKAPASAQGQLLFYSPSKVMVPTVAPPATGSSTSVGLGVVSPHELLQKLQLVQQEQSGGQEHSRPSLAPSFHKAPLQHSLPTSQNTTEPAKVNSPQRIPATVAPTLLLSPSVFSQAKGPRTEPEEPRVLSRSQLQAILLHLIRNDASFLDTIYQAYVSSLAKDSSSPPF
ncbi:mRNA-decapping enzyme 1B [Colossoma macropomum]|uniref:mRNA-decapping enzyme 1B n=1 Tax=Colossoma macropomum TaxID=42526 RepID=UPI0018651191|nr:mRNA-decapping enzyme 1B [Colossoma macropomum]